MQRPQESGQWANQNLLGMRFPTDREALQDELKVFQQEMPSFQLSSTTQYLTTPTATSTASTQRHSHTELGVGFSINDKSISFSMHESGKDSKTIIPQSFNGIVEKNASHNQHFPISATSVPTGPKNKKRTSHQQGKQIKKPKIPPSRASGGIPHPRPLYLFCSTVESRSEEPPLPKLLVLDLNGTLLFRRKTGSTFKVRPSARIFLDFVLENFKVMIWSSADEVNVRKMCEGLLPKGANRALLAEWSRKHLDLDESDYWKRVQVYKRLWKIWDDQDIQAKHPLRDQAICWSQVNTILIDDEMEKARSEPYNLVHIPEYTGQHENPNTLKLVAQYLYRLRGQSNVSAYIREHPFKMPQ